MSENSKQNREHLIEYLQKTGNDPEGELISDQKVDLIYALLTLSCPTKNDLLSIAGFTKPEKNYDTATPLNHVRKIMEIYPDFENGSYINDYSGDHIWGKITNVYNIFAKHVINTLSLD